MPSGSVKPTDDDDDDDQFEDTVPVEQLSVSSSKYGARGTLETLSPLPLDAEQLLRVRTSMAQKTQTVVHQHVAIESFGHEVGCVPKWMLFCF